MRTTLLAIATGAGLLFSAAAFADETASLQTASASSDKQIVCHFMVHEGMVVPHATQCHTQRYWDNQRRLVQQSVRDFQNRSFQMPIN